MTALDMRYKFMCKQLPGCGMGPPLLVSPCLRENVVVTCKILSFLCSLDTLLQKNVIVFFFWKSNFKMALIWKKGYFWPTFHIFSHQGKVAKFFKHVSHSHTYIHVFCSPYWLFCLTNCEKIRIYQVWFLLGVILAVDSYSRHFGTINK